MINKDNIYISQWDDSERDWIPRDSNEINIFSFESQIIYFDRVIEGSPFIYSEFLYVLSESEKVEHMLKYGSNPIKIDSLQLSDLSLSTGNLKPESTRLKFCSPPENVRTIQDYLNYLLDCGCKFEKLKFE